MTVLEALRAGTRPLHDRLEARLDFLDPRLTLDVYRVRLRSLHGFYSPVEEALAACAALSETGFNLDERRKTPLLERALLTLGESPEGVRTLERCPRLPAVSSLPEALGCLYVLEGATLGGQLIVRQLRRSLRLGEAGLAFFNSYGPEVGPRWRAFLEVLARHGSAAEDRPIIVQSACHTFSAFEAWLFPEPAPAEPAAGAFEVTPR